ncbi:MAG: HNH endonuclease [Bacteroidales bacterium]|nr:HNH endonuclease [Bacteroidales bacterium]
MTFLVTLSVSNASAGSSDTRGVSLQDPTTQFEIIDGQQRTISICQYVNGDFAFNFRYFHNLQPDEQEQILNYELQVYICSGSDSEKLKWFKTINIAGKELTEQELRNAVYSGSWVSDAKRYFSKNGAPAAKIGGDYLTGSAIRQDYLETAISWISDGNVEVYMSNHQHDPSAAPLWQFFQSVITWIETSFRPTKERKKIMKGVDWGMLYKQYKDQVFDFKAVDDEVKRLILDDDVTKKTGIYPYILTRKEKYLSIRAFTDAQKMAAYERQMGFCDDCGQHFDLSQMEADHITPWHLGGKTVAENCQMLCRDCNRRKSGK